jgi:soluble lytic murein transglycosylase-like protein
MPFTRRTALTMALISPLAACAGRSSNRAPASRAGLFPGETPEMRSLIRKYADVHDIPESLLHRVIQRESGYNAGARNGPYFGLMQILPQTASTMGYRGSPEGLLDAETNLIYAGRYLRGAWLVSGRDESAAVGWYARGYYYEAKRLGLLEETGLRA